jgi:penicillin-binding protein 1C
LAATEAVRLQPLEAERHAPHVVRALREATARGGTLTTTLSLDLQRDVEAIVAESLRPLAGTGADHAAVVVIDNASGGVLAMVGSAGDGRPGGHFNGAAVRRSAGSALKPFTYLLAFETLGAFPGTVLPDVPTAWRTPEGLDLPQNFDVRHRGPVTVREALACSLNVPAMRQLDALGGPAPLARMLERLGVDLGPGNPSGFGLGLTIGSAEVSLLDLTGAYATLARLGRHLPTTLLAAEAGTVHGDGGSLVTPESAWLVADILADNAARSPAFGPSSPLRLPFPCAAKTGTSSDFRDNWCLGFTATFTVGVWVGNFQARPMDSVTGVSGAGPVFHRVIQRLHRDRDPEWLPLPDGLTRIWTDPRTGRLAAPPGDPAAALPGGVAPRQEWCRRDQLPARSGPADYEPDGRAHLDARYRDWFESAENSRSHHFALAPDLPAPASRPKILQPQHLATYHIDPELPSLGDSLRLISNLPGPATWHCPTLTTTGETLHLAPGEHTVKLTDPASGQSATATIRVQEL